MHTTRLGNPDAPLVVFGHGWNRTGQDFIGVAEALGNQVSCLMLDFPGFGQTPRPIGTWTTQDYAEATTEFLAAYNQPFVWVGHSFGARVGLRLGAMGVSNLTSMLLIGPAGLQRRRRGWEQLRFLSRKYGYQLLKRFADSQGREALRQKFSSADYLLRPDLQDIFIATVREEQSASVASIQCPVSLMVGEQDQEAPPEIAHRLHRLMPHSKLVELPDVGHIDILMRSRHLIAKIILEHLCAQNSEAL